MGVSLVLHGSYPVFASLIFSYFPTSRCTNSDAGKLGAHERAPIDSPLHSSGYKRPGVVDEV